MGDCPTSQYVTAPFAVPFFVPATIANALLSLTESNHEALYKTFFALAEGCEGQEVA